MRIRTYYLNERKTVSLKAYLLDNISGLSFCASRPAILICPGGGYEFLSDREGEPIAMQFLARGFNAFVLDYSINKRHPQPLINAAWALANIRMRYKEYSVDPNKIAVCGFSAGGHLAGSLATMWNDPTLSHYISMPAKSFRPNAAVLSYPVVSGVTMPHKGSFDVLLGADASFAERANLSLESRVSADTPPMFIWHTGDDGCVPPQNSLVLASACFEHKVPCELHIYDEGPHGLSDCYKTTATSPAHDSPHCAAWIELAATFLRKYLEI